MKSLGLAVFVALATLLTQAGEASAQEWWMQVISHMKSQNAPAAARAAAGRPAREAPARRATLEGDDGSRPQRRGEQASRERQGGRGGETGVASYYWQPQPVASGGRFNPNAWTAAHKSLPFGTRVRVTRLDNGNSVEVTINDRGPYVAGRIIDLSRRAAQSIGMTGVGVTRVKVAVLGR